MPKLIYGIGYNSGGRYKITINKKRSKIYAVWTQMLGRCYNDKVRTKNPSYKGCTVDERWHNFQVFAEWYTENHPNDGGAYQLDKDLLFIGNKVYSPDRCLIIHQSVNKFTIARNACRGNLLIGVTIDPYSGLYLARCNNPFTRKQERLGLFQVELDAHKAWRKRKSELAIQLAESQHDSRVKQAIINWKYALDNNLIHTIN